MPPTTRHEWKQQISNGDHASSTANTTNPSGGTMPAAQQSAGDGHGPNAPASPGHIVEQLAATTVDHNGGGGGSSSPRQPTQEPEVSTLSVAQTRQLLNILVDVERDKLTLAGTAFKVKAFVDAAKTLGLGDIKRHLAADTYHRAMKGYKSILQLMSQSNEGLAFDPKSEMLKENELGAWDSVTTHENANIVTLAKEWRDKPFYFWNLARRISKRFDGTKKGPKSKKPAIAQPSRKSKRKAPTSEAPVQDAPASVQDKAVSPVPTGQTNTQPSDEADVPPPTKKLCQVGDLFTNPKDFNVMKEIVAQELQTDPERAAQIATTYFTKEYTKFQTIMQKRSEAVQAAAKSVLEWQKNLDHHQQQMSTVISQFGQFTMETARNIRSDHDAEYRRLATLKTDIERAKKLVSTDRFLSVDGKITVLELIDEDEKFMDKYLQLTVNPTEIDVREGYLLKLLQKTLKQKGTDIKSLFESRAGAQK